MKTLPRCRRYYYKNGVSCQIVDDNNATYELTLTATDHGDPARSTAAHLRMVIVVSRLISPAAGSDAGTEAGRRRAGIGVPLLDGWIAVAVAAACAVGLVLLCALFSVLACILQRRRRRRDCTKTNRDCAKRQQNVDAAAAVPLTGNYNCRAESLKAVGVCDTGKG